MLDDYLQGAATQLIERASALKGQIPRPPRIEFAQLASLCCTKIDIAIGELRKIRDDPDWRGPAAASVRLLEFRRIAAQIDRVENEAIAAMTLSGRKEAPFNRLLYRMTQEINYPIELPTISLLSQNYFYINTDFKLLCVPLMELHFLLHLPDVYHELAHPLLQAEDDPRTKLWSDAFLRAQSSIGDHFRNQIIEANSARGPDFIRFALAAAYENFQFQWLEEFFCDLFGVFSVGPAYAWAHLHLHAERGNNAFLLPRPRSRHPADAPRMEMMLMGSCC